MSGEFEDLHVCGYELRHDDPALRDVLADFRADRGRRIWAMADRLEELGFVLDRAPLHAREAAGAPLGRPTSPTPCSRPRQRGEARGRGDHRQGHAVPAVSRAWRRGLRGAFAADGGGGDRRDPRRRRRRRLGAPVLGHRRPRHGARGDRALRGLGARRRRGSSMRPTTRSRRERSTPPRASAELLVTGSADFHGPTVSTASARSISTDWNRYSDRSEPECSSA